MNGFFYTSVVLRRNECGCLHVHGAAVLGTDLFTWDTAPFADGAVLRGLWVAGLFHPLLCSFCGFTALFPKGTVLLQLLFACLFQGVTLFCVFPVVDRQCLVLARQCRKKKSAGRCCLYWPITYWAAGGTGVYQQGQTVAGWCKGMLPSATVTHQCSLAHSWPANVCPALPQTQRRNSPRCVHSESGGGLDNAPTNTIMVSPVAGPMEADQWLPDFRTCRNMWPLQKTSHVVTNQLVTEIFMRRERRRYIWEKIEPNWPWSRIECGPNKLQAFHTKRSLGASSSMSIRKNTGGWRILTRGRIGTGSNSSGNVARPCRLDRVHTSCRCPKHTFCPGYCFEWNGASYAGGGVCRCHIAKDGRTHLDAD